MSRRHILALAFLLAALGGLIALARHAPAHDERPKSPRLAAIERALARAVQFLISQQTADGAFRSDTYGTFKDGPALTPLTLVALQEAGPQLRSGPARTKAANYLAGFARADGSIDEGPHGLDYPAYTAAYSVTALSQPDCARLVAARDAWLTHLNARQLTEPLGWTPDDPEYGGWGYCRSVPTKPTPGVISPPLIESNLSATATALDALAAAGKLTERERGPASVFVRRCQNFAEGRAATPPDDGGFFFIHDDPVRNKAGVAAVGIAPRFHSYGSATADGLRALRHCGQTDDDDRVIAARTWLTERFAPGRHPGIYVERHESNRQAVYFYFSASLARTLDVRLGERDYVGELADELVSRQQANGSWQNPAHAMREDDPVAATALVVRALGACRRVVK